MRISLFENYFDSAVKHLDIEWEDFVTSIVGPHTYSATKETAPQFSPAEFKEGERRTNENVIRLWLACFDFDSVTVEDKIKLEEFLTKQGLGYVLYTTFSHTKNASPRFRIVLDLDRPVLVKEWTSFWDRLVDMFPVKPDMQCRSPSHMYARTTTHNLQDAEHKVVDGGLVSVDSILQRPYTPSKQLLVKKEQTITQPLDPKALERHARNLGRKTAQWAVDMGRWLEYLVEGKPFALSGTRHNTVVQITQYLERVYSKVSIEDLTRLFSASCQNMDWEEGIEEARKALIGAREKRLQEVQSQETIDSAIRERLIREAFSGSDRIEPYTEQDIENFAELAGTTPTGFMKRWIIQHGTAYYIWVDGSYRPALPERSVPPSAQRDLAPAFDIGIQLKEFDPMTGRYKIKGTDKLVQDYGTVARHAEASFKLTATHYDAETQTITEALAVPSNLTPKYSPEVEHWLKLLAGDRYDDLLLWLRLVRNLDDPLCALYLDGPMNSGKSLFPEGLARLWGTSGCLSAESATSAFPALTKSPVVFADECLPPAWEKAGGLANFRAWVAARERDLNRKYLPVIPLHGCMRIILAANNPDLIKSTDALTPQDRDAIVDRLFHIKIPETAAMYLRELGPARCKAFVAEDEMARHVLWIEQEYAHLERQGRFGIIGKKSELHMTIKHAQPLNAAVSEWLVGFLLDPKQYETSNRGFKDANARIHNGKFYINVKALNTQNNWSLYVSSPERVPTTHALNRALQELAPQKEEIGVVSYRVVDINELVSYAEHAQLATSAQLRQAII